MHFITALRYDEQKDEVDSGGSFGYFTNCEDAHKAVAYNTGDMHECYYNYLVIEDIPPGIHPIPKLECWFKWNSEQEAWEYVDAPKFSCGIINWCLG